MASWRKRSGGSSTIICFWPALEGKNCLLLRNNGTKRQPAVFGVSIVQYSEGNRYDWHRGVDIPCPLQTPLVAVGPGVVRINGSHPGYSDGIVQIRHEDWYKFLFVRKPDFPALHSSLLVAGEN